MSNKQWYKLDNVGRYYSSLAGGSYQSVFRYSASLKDPIDKKLLQEALNDTLCVYRNFYVHLKKGLFWYYLQESSKKYEVIEEKLPICSRIYYNEKDFLFRVSFYDRRISFEVCHILSDGRGSVEFFKTLISNYVILKYHLKGVQIITNSSFIEKSEDSFSKYYKKGPTEMKSIRNIYRYKQKMLRKSTRYMELHTIASKVLDISHQYHVSLTVLIVSVLIYSFRNVLTEKDIHKNIKIDIPVDLRSYYKSSSSKNYFGLTSIVYQFNSREDTLFNIMEQVNDQLKKKLLIDKLESRINQCIAFQNNVFCRLSPLFLKNIVLRIVDFFARRNCTTCVSNIGVIKLDEKIVPFVSDINVICSTTEFQFMLCSYNDDLSIGISSKYRYNDVIKEFSRWFSNNNLPVTINVSEVD